MARTSKVQAKKKLLVADSVSVGESSQSSQPQVATASNSQDGIHEPAVSVDLDGNNIHIKVYTKKNRSFRNQKPVDYTEVNGRGKYKQKPFGVKKYGFESIHDSTDQDGETDVKQSTNGTEPMYNHKGFKGKNKKQTEKVETEKKVEEDNHNTTTTTNIEKSKRAKKATVTGKGKAPAKKKVDKSKAPAGENKAQALDFIQELDEGLKVVHVPTREMVPKSLKRTPPASGKTLEKKKKKKVAAAAPTPVAKKKKKTTNITAKKAVAAA